MKLIPFDKEKHLSIVNSWLELNNHEIANEVPEWGCITINDDKFVACGFIRRIEGGYGMLDGYATNPLVSSDLRDKSLDMITIKLVKFAKHNEIKGLTAISIHNNTIKRAIRHGFEKLPHVFISLKL